METDNDVTIKLLMERVAELIAKWERLVADHLVAIDRAEAAEGALKSENAAIADYLRYCAGNYPEGSDGRNTFVMAASWVEALASEA